MTISWLSFSGGRAFPASRRMEPIKFQLAILLGVAVVCLLLFAVFQKRSDMSLEKYTELQSRYHTISTVSLITQKSLLRVQSGFENMLLAASEAELETARLGILEAMASIESAIIFFEEGGQFTETFAVNFDGLDKVSHTFQVEPTPGQKSIATIEMRSSLSLLTQALEQYYAFSQGMIREHARLDAPSHATELVLMHKKLNPFFIRAGEYSNRLYVQSVRDLRRATEERRSELALHRDGVLGILAVALGLLLATGTLVFRSADKILADRAFQTDEASRSNAMLRAEIEERGRAEKALRQSEERFRSYFEHSQVGMSMTTPDKTWLEINPKQVEMLGYSLDELHQTDWAALTHPDDLAMDLGQYGRMLAGEIESFSMDKRFMHKNGGVVHVNLAVSCVRGPGGAVELVLASYLDITARRQAEEALKHSEQGLRNLYELAPLGIFAATPQGRYLRVNRAQAAIYGYDSPEEMIRLVTDIPAQIYVDPGERDRIMAMLEADGRIVNLETQRKTKSGGRIWINLNMRAVPGADGQTAFFEGFSMDITRRKRAELASQESQAELRKLWKAVENSPATIVITDASGIIQYVNPHFTALTGYTSQEALGHTPRILKSGVHPAEFFQDMWRALLSGAVWRGEICNRKKNGDLYWELASISPIIGADGAITNFVAVKEDITDRMRQDMKLKRALSELQAIFNASSVGIAYMNASLSVVRINNRLAELFGYDDQALHELGIGVLFPSPEHFQNFSRTHLERMALREMIKTETQLRSRSGHLVWCSVAARLLDAVNPELGSIWVFDDITARIDLENMRAEVERIMRHDLKAPLNGIINLPGLIAAEGPLTDDQRSMLNMIRDAGMRMLDQTELSLDLYRMESGTYELTPTAVDLRQVADKACEVLGPTIRARNIVISRREDDACGHGLRALGNELLCYTILGNLLKNAVEASASGQTVEIAISCVPDFVRVAIHNPGQIPAEIQPVFFEKYSTFGKKRGTGLGTYSARLMTQCQHGRIGFTSSERDGVVVFIELPIFPEGGAHG
jgi:PAS domain S-box-containing protein